MKKRFSPYWPNQDKNRYILDIIILAKKNFFLSEFDILVSPELKENNTELGLISNWTTETVALGKVIHHSLYT